MIFLIENSGILNQNVSRLFLFILLFQFHKNHAQQWELKKDKNGIKVYTRQVKDAKIKEYKAIVLVKTSVEHALKVITDGDNLWKWNHKTSDSKNIKTISETEFVFWMKNDLPWPVKNRDFISRIKVSYQNEGSVTIDIIPEITHTLPQEKNTIRVKEFNGHWRLEPKGEYVEITQQLYGDPGGNFPAWLLNAVMTTVPYRTFLNLKEILEN